MKISFLLPGNTNRPTGGYKVIYEYCNKLVNYGNNVIIYYYYGSMFENLHFPEFARKVLVRTFSETVGPGLWFKLDKKVRKKVINSPKEIRNADVIIATAIDTANDVLNLPPQCGRKLYFIQGFENWKYSDNEVLDSYGFGMVNIVVSRWLKNIVDSHSNVPSYLIPNCINTEIFFDKKNRRRKHSIVFHYRSDACKGGEYAIGVIKELAQIYDDLYVDVISIEKKPDDLPNCCIYHRKITAEEVSRINNCNQIFMCTSIEEGFGLPGLEAMACGCAVVSTSYKGVLEYAIDGKNALLSPIRDVKSMVNNIQLLFENDDLRKEIMNNGIITAHERSLEASAKAFEKVLKDSCISVKQE